MQHAAMFPLHDSSYPQAQPVATVEGANAD